ncbi:MAG: BMC domain-containing protein [Lachnospiraceae bacterium]|nr:BMC domain-containing protein [Lachnospiraceae bacterium]
MSKGVTAADEMVKTSNVELLEAETVCPGKYIALIAGELSAVKSSDNIYILFGHILHLSADGCVYRYAEGAVLKSSHNIAFIYPVSYPYNSFGRSSYVLG